MVVNMRELVNYDCIGMAGLLKEKAIQPLELLEATIEQIEKINPVINAVVGKMYDSARMQVGSIDMGKPLAGVPFLLKDATGFLEGTKISVGSRLLKDYIASYTSTMVERLLNAGLLILGKTNVPEFCLLPTTEPLLWGPTRNPWDLSRSPGGSSGGSAAAVAACLVPGAHATDGGGSIRVPASFCGVVGLKPSRGRTPIGPMMTDLTSSSMYEGVITRTVRDSAALLDATHGSEIGDPYQIAAPERPFIQEMTRAPDKLKIAFTAQSATETSIDEDCAAAVRHAALLCEDLGHIVVEDYPALDMGRLNKIFKDIYCTGPSARIDMIETMLGNKIDKSDIEPLTWAMNEVGKHATVSQLAAWKAELGLAMRQVGYFMHDNAYDLLISPVTPGIAPPLGYFDFVQKDPLQGLDRAIEYVQFTWLHNLTGMPAISLPVFWNKNNLPVGVQFAAKVGNEALLLQLGCQLESASPWFNKIPSISQ